MGCLTRAQGRAPTSMLRDRLPSRPAGPRRRLRQAWSVAAPSLAGAVLAALAACGTQRPAPATPEDTTFAGADTTGRVADDTVAPSPDTTASPSNDPAQSPPGSADTASTHAGPDVPGATPAIPIPPPTLSPTADSIAQFMVFDPTMQTWFLAAKRGKRLLVDIGRVDSDVRDKRHAAAYAEAVKALSPVPIGTPVRVYDAWGVEDDTVAGFDRWNGRIVATLHLSPHLDSLVGRTPTAFAAIERIDTAHTDAPTNRDTTASAPDSAHRAAPASPDTTAHKDSLAAADSCRRDSVPAPLLARATAVRDSIDAWLRALPPPPFDRLVNTERSVSSQVVGCFGAGNRIAMAVDLRAGVNEWIRERAVLIDTLGKVTTLKVYDFRFKGHDLVAALDPNGRHIDGLVARGAAQATGGTVILSLEPGNRLTRWVTGFAWEDR